MSRIGAVATRASFAITCTFTLAFFSGGTALARPTGMHAARLGVSLGSLLRWNELALVNGWASSQSTPAPGGCRVGYPRRPRTGLPRVGASVTAG